MVTSKPNRIQNAIINHALSDTLYTPHHSRYMHNPRWWCAQAAVVKQAYAGVSSVSWTGASGIAAAVAVAVAGAHLNLSQGDEGRVLLHCLANELGGLSLQVGQSAMPYHCHQEHLASSSPICRLCICTPMDLG